MQHNLLKNAVISIALLTLLSACGQTKAPAQEPAKDSSASKPQAQTSAPQPQQTPAPTAPAADNKQQKIKAYFGDENGEKLIEQETIIFFKSDNEKYLAALKALSTSPDSKQLAFFKGFTFKTAALKDGLLTVDASMAPEARLGAGGEELLLQALKRTVFQFSEINSVEFLLDGKAVESLMGHMELPHPIKRG
jgi:hypothetical protein